jgi:ribosomal protein S27AE
VNCVIGIVEVVYVANDCPACGGKNTVVPASEHNDRYTCLNCAMFYIIRSHPVTVVIKHQGRVYSSIEKAKEAMQKEQGIS